MLDDQFMFENLFSTYFLVRNAVCFEKVFLEAGYAETMAAMVGLGIQRMAAEANQRMFNLLQEAIPSSSPFYLDASAIGLQPEHLNIALREVEDAVKPAPALCR